MSVEHVPTIEGLLFGVADDIARRNADALLGHSYYVYSWPPDRALSPSFAITMHVERSGPESSEESSPNEGRIDAVEIEADDMLLKVFRHYPPNLDVADDTVWPFVEAVGSYIEHVEDVDGPNSDLFLAFQALKQQRGAVQLVPPLPDAA